MHYASYSRVHISSDKAFFKILKKPSIVQKQTPPHMKAMVIFIEKNKIIGLKNPITENKSKKNFKMADLENSKWPPKKSSFSSSASSQYFFMKISWIGPWVSKID